jgi:cytochrome c-type biogenesis protein CcmE
MSRRFQFSLRALLLTVAVAAVFAFILLSIRESRSLFLTPSEKRYQRQELDRLADEARGAYVRARGNNPETHDQ